MRAAAKAVKLTAEIDFLIPFARGNNDANKCKQFGHKERFVYELHS